MNSPPVAAPAHVPDRVELEGLAPEQTALLQFRYPVLHAALVEPPAPPEEADA